MKSIERMGNTYGFGYSVDDAANCLAAHYEYKGYKIIRTKNGAMVKGSVLGDGYYEFEYDTHNSGRVYRVWAVYKGKRERNPITRGF